MDVKSSTSKASAGMRTMVRKTEITVEGNCREQMISSDTERKGVASEGSGGNEDRVPVTWKEQEPCSIVAGGSEMVP